jgi:hypothetical protein
VATGSLLPEGLLGEQVMTTSGRSVPITSSAASTSIEKSSARGSVMVRVPVILGIKEWSE